MMKKGVCLLLAVFCLAGLFTAASAEKGLETLYELYSAEEIFGEQQAEYDYEGGDDAKVCFAIFLFDTENDMTVAILIGRNEDGEQKYYQWIMDYEPGAQMLTSLLGRFGELKGVCEEGVDFCISFSYDGGENMTDIDTQEKAAEYLASLPETEEPAEAP